MSSSNVRRRVIQNYTLHQLLGQGVYGKVYRARHKQHPQQFAIKVIPVQLFKQNKKLQECTVNEINTLSSIRPSAHIVKYIEMLKTSNNFYFVYQFCNGGTLEGRLKKEKFLNEKDGLEVLRQLVQAFKVLNQYNIMHRDIKPDNILFHDGVVKLGDFGFCKGLQSDNAMTSTMLGSPIYMAPEVLKGEQYSSKADVWSLGVVLFEILFGYCPFESNSIANLISTIKESNLRLPLEINEVSEGAQYLIKRMLVKDPMERVGWGDIFQMEFFVSKEEVDKKKGDKQKQKEKQKQKSREKKDKSIDKVKQQQKSKQKEISPPTKSLQKQSSNPIVIQKQQSLLALGKNLNQSISKKESIEQRQIQTQPKLIRKDSYSSKQKYQTQYKPINTPSLASTAPLNTSPITSPTPSIVTPTLQYKPPTLDPIPISHSLSWQNDHGFKNYLANASKPSPTPSPKLSEPSQPDSFAQISSLSKFFSPPQPSLSPTAPNILDSISVTNSISSMTYSLPSISQKRKSILLSHQLCTRGIKTAIDIINVQDPITLTYSYLILTSIESKLRKIQDSILSTESQLRDIYFALTIQLTGLEKSIGELKDQLVEQDVSVGGLGDPRGYLGQRWREGQSQESVKIWYQMVYVLFGGGEKERERGWGREMGKGEMADYVRGKLF